MTEALKKIKLLAMEDSENRYIGPERRRYPRLKAAVIEYYLLNGTATEEPSFTRDIGAGGISIIINEEVAVETLLGLKIFLPNQNYPVKAKGRVAWVTESSLKLPNTKHYDVGIEFIEINELDKQKISQYVAKPSW